jgi:hypothetical protein
MSESEPNLEQSLSSTGHVSQNFFELFTHDGGVTYEQETGDDLLPPFFMSAPEFQAADPFFSLPVYDGASTSERDPSWWTGDEALAQQIQTSESDIAWPSAFQRVLDSMAVDFGSGE